MPLSEAYCPGLTGDEARSAFARLASAGAEASADAGDPAVIGYVCSYVPEEIILAAGFHPVRLGGRPGPVGPADGYLQSFACSYARSCLDSLLLGRAGRLSGVVFAYTCDSLRAVAETWRLHGPAGSFFHFLNLPAGLDGPLPVRYAASVFRDLASALASAPGGRPVTAAGLEEASKIMGKVHAALGRLAALRRARPDLFPGSAFAAVARGASVGSRLEAARDLGLIAADLERNTPASTREGTRAMDREGFPGRTRPGGRPRLLVSGGYLETDQVLRLIEEAGADIVADDLCLAGRRLGPAYAPDRGGDASALQPGPDDGSPNDPDPFARLAEAYVRQVPCPTKHPPERRFEFILREADTALVDGVIFILQKFCDPHAFDFPHLRDLLEAAGRPALLLEVEQGGVSAGQAATRVEAFLECLSPPAVPNEGGVHA